MQEGTIPHAVDAVAIPMHSAIVAKGSDTVWTSTGVPATGNPTSGISARALKHDWQRDHEGKNKIADHRQASFQVAGVHLRAIRCWRA
jgi:hypothetical protein